jgi:hypothetical protein
VKVTRSTIVTAVVILVLVAVFASAVRDTFDTGRVSVFSRQFLEELPRCLTGPGRCRFFLQPLLAILLRMASAMDAERPLEGWHPIPTGRCHRYGVDAALAQPIPQGLPI